MASKVPQWKFDDLTERNAATDVQSGEYCLVVSEDKFYLWNGVTWDDVTAVPDLHATSHQNGGSDEINVAGLSGVLADPQTPAAHAASHQNGGGDEINVAGLSGVLADPQTPATHASSHENGGGDEINVAGLSGVLADAQTPAAHASTHSSGGSDPIDHGNLAGLGDAADHTWAALVDGTRNITGDQVFEADVQVDGELYVGTDGTLSTAPFQFVGGNSMIAISDVGTDATNKSARIGCLHYTNGEQPAAMLFCASQASENIGFFGGGTSTMNACTELRFVTAANNTTTTGTVRVTIDSDGHMAATQNVTADGQLRGGSSTATVSGTAVTLDFDNGNSIEFDAQPATGDITVTLDNMQDGGIYYAVFLQGSTARTLTFTASGLTIKWSSSDPDNNGGGTQPSAIGFNNRYDIYKFHRVGSNVFAVLDWRDELSPG